MQVNQRGIAVFALPLSGKFHRQKDQDGFEADAADDYAVVENSFPPRPGKHIHG